MKIDEASGPGIDDWLIDRLRGWGTSDFTDVQVKALHAGIADACSMVVSSPIPSGKTLIGEIAASLALRAGTRAIYFVSHKALADQKYIDFVARFGEGAAHPIASVGLNTGDRQKATLTHS